MTIAYLLLKQRIVGQKYGMLDLRLHDAINDITVTFCSRTFHNINPLVLETLVRMTKNYEIEKETICVSYGRLLWLGPIDLFKFLNEIIDTSMHCPCEEVLRSTIGLISKILFNFQKEYRDIVSNADDMEMPVFCSLTNSSMKFLSNLKSFEDRIIKLNILPETTVINVSIFD